MMAGVPTGPVPEHLDHFLRAPHPAVVATLRPDGAPVTEATWYLWKDGRFMLTMYADGARARNLAKDPRASLTVLGDDWYEHVSLRGRVVELRADPDWVDIDEMSHRYRGVPYPRDKPFTGLTAIVAVDSWHEWSSPTKR
jgi:PPOX class probable F420-dependent enzyme